MILEYEYMAKILYFKFLLMLESVKKVVKDISQDTYEFDDIYPHQVK